MVTSLPPSLLLFWMGHCDSGDGSYVSGGLFFSRGLVRPLCGLGISCSQQLTCHPACECGSSNLAWEGPHLPDRTHFPLPWPGSLHLPARLGPGFVPVGEARHAQACRPLRLVWPQSLQSWQRGRQPRGSPHPAREGGTLFSFPSLSSLKSSFIYMTRGYLSIPTSRPASTFIILVVNHTLKPKTFDKLSVLGIVLMSHSCYSLSFP